MKTKTLAALSTAVFLSMSAVAHAQGCNKKFWFQYSNGDACFPWSFGRMKGGTANIYKGLWGIGTFGSAAGTFTCANWHWPARFCDLVKKSKEWD